MISNLLSRSGRVVIENILPESFFEFTYWASHIICARAQYHQICSFSVQTISFLAYEYLQKDLSLEDCAYTLSKRAAKNFAGSLSKILPVSKETIKVSPKIVMDLCKQNTIDSGMFIKYTTSYFVESRVGKNLYPHEKGFKNEILVYEILLYIIYDVVNDKDVQKYTKEFFIGESIENVLPQLDYTEFSVDNDFIQYISMSAHEGMDNCSSSEIY